MYDNLIFLSLRFCPKFCFQILIWNFGFSKQISVCKFSQYFSKTHLILKNIVSTSWRKRHTLCIFLTQSAPFNVYVSINNSENRCFEKWPHLRTALFCTCFLEKEAVKKSNFFEEKNKWVVSAKSTFTIATSAYKIFQSELFLKRHCIVGLTILLKHIF